MKALISTALVVLSIICCFTGTCSKSFVDMQGQAYVMSSTNSLQGRHKRSLNDDSKKGTAIKSMHVTSVVMSRFARVTVESEVKNTLNDSKEIIFSLRLPEAAFITEFDMKVSGVTFVGEVKEKEEAKNQFQTAVDRGNSAGLVTADVRETQTFNIAAHVAANSSVTFNLVYQELLNRKLGEYSHVILINPRQLVDDLLVEVYITETTALTSVSVDLPNSNDAGRKKSGDFGVVPIDYNIRRSKHQAKITFTPTKDQQRRLMMIPEDERKMTVRYDVTREVLGGEILTRNGYFVHFFAPENLPVLPKNVVFVIDRSGSMSGRKIEQTKEAFTSVLKELRNSDKFNIISFNGGVSVWNKEHLVNASKGMVDDAVAYVSNISASGSTNINSAMLKAAKLLESNISETSSMIILLTDGNPTAEVTNRDQIRLNVKTAVGGKYSVFCLGFGKNLDHDFLKKMGNENDGLARQIYEDSDADLQLEGFFHEVASPLLQHVRIKYNGSAVNDVTNSKFDKFFKGSEVVVTGEYEKEDKELRTIVKAEGRNGKQEYRVESTPIDVSFRHWFKDTGDFDNFIERLWAYFTIRELIMKKSVSDSTIERQRLNSRILELALRYGFVTPLTSMVVTLPEDETTISPEIPTIHPPLPPCFMRNQIVPDYIIGPPVWCPYVMSDDEVKTRPSNQQTIQSARQQSPRSRNAPSRSRWFNSRALASYSGSASFAGSSGSVSPRSFGFPSGRMAFSPPLTFPPVTSSPKYRAVTERPRRLTRCNKSVNETSGKVASVKVKRKSSCEWTIVLEKGSWIALHVESIDSKFDKLKIISIGEIVFEHDGGNESEKYFLIKSNEVRIQMTLFGKGKSQSIVVNYGQYIPGGKRTSESQLDIFDVKDSNFSDIIYSSNNTSGFISSPNYPESYPSNTRAVWNIINQDPDNLRLQITFIDMDIEMSGDGKCLNDKVVVKYGVRERELCGYDVTGASWKTKREIVQIAFISDDKLETSGFKMEYKFI